MTLSSRPTSLIIVGQRNVVSDGVRALVEMHAGLSVLDGPSEPARALTLRVEPDVVARPPRRRRPRRRERDGVGLIRRLHEAFCGRRPILVLTSVDDPVVVRGTLAAGAAGDLLKSAETAEASSRPSTRSRAAAATSKTRSGSRSARHLPDSGARPQQLHSARPRWTSFVSSYAADTRTPRSPANARGEPAHRPGATGERRTPARPPAPALDLVRYAVEHGLGNQMDDAAWPDKEANE